MMADQRIPLAPFLRRSADDIGERAIMSKEIHVDGGDTG